jgi:hypothetical protein
MAKYRKRPIVVDAVQWIGSMAPVIDLVGHDLPTYGPSGQLSSLRIATLEGDHECQIGDWIIKGIQGEFYPCKPDIFAATYEPATRPLVEAADVLPPALAQLERARQVGGKQGWNMVAAAIASIKQGAGL